MTNNKESQPGGDVLAVCNALVFRFDGQTREWHETGGVSKLLLVRTPIVYQIDGRLESTGQVTIKVPLGQNSEYSNLDEDPTSYRLTISPQEVYIFRIARDEGGKTFSYLLQTVLRNLRETETRQVEPPSSPREAWVPQREAAPPSPSQPISEQLQTSSNLGNRIPLASMFPSTRHLVKPLNPPITSMSKVMSSSTPNLSEERTAQNQQTISTINTSELSPTYSSDQRFMTTTAVRRSDFEAQVENLCEELAEVIRQGDENTASEIVRVMAQEQVPLSIKMKNPKVVTVEHGKETIDLKVVVEDRETSGGAFVMKVFPSTKIQTLQEEVAERFGFPPKVQKWIIGKVMARPSNTLADCYVNKAGHTAFLYLISGKSAGLTKGEFERYVKRTEEGSFSALGQQIPNGTPVSIGVASPMPDTTLLSRTTSMPVLNTVGVPRTEGFASHSIAVQPPTRPVNQSQPINQGEALNSRDQRIQSASDITAIQEELQREQAINLHSIPVEDTEEVQPAGWKCTACTYVNTPTRPGCEMCGGDRPDGYVVPENTMIREQERNRIAEERRQQELFEQALQQQEQEQAIARETNFLQLVQTAQQNLIKNTEEFDCAICYTTVLPEEGVVLRECLHSFCRDCLREHIRNCTDPEVQCPFQDNEFACHSLITAQEIKSLLSAEDFNKYLNRSLVTAESQAANSFHCKTPNCPGWCIYEDNSNIFHCPVCDKQNCLTCKAQHFPDMNCKEYQDDLKRRAQNDKAAQQTQQFLENMIAKGEAMKCPQCEIILLKKDGCDWMRCSMCRLEICWATRGPRWGPQGVGDSSGGCKCRVGGKKCHPKCQNCH